MKSIVSWSPLRRGLTVRSYGAGRAARVPRSCCGKDCGLGTVGAGSLPVSTTFCRLPLVSGSSGQRGSRPEKSKTLVRSPQTERRQGLMLGSWTPKRCSRKRSTEVWS
ncbi:hypothetical protein VR45_36345 [Streptomyces sp. NRRL S-495]|nr:hypothetical protein VR45_36345 [Streptomyces sp. NRRL S-495]